MVRLGEVIRANINAGVLPRKRPDTVVAGSGDGEACTACAAPILANQVQWSVHGPRGISHRFHVGCHGVWDAQLRKIGAIVDERRRTPVSVIVNELRRYPHGLCQSCLAERAAMPMGLVSAVVVELAVSRAAYAGPTARVCEFCGYRRRVVRRTAQLARPSIFR